MVLQPRQCRNINGLGSCAFARHYLRNHFYFLFLWVLRCFSSPRSPSLRNGWPSTSRVAPFGYPRIKGYLHLPAAFRSLSRPSSPPRAKASTVCPFLLSLFHSCMSFIMRFQGHRRVTPTAYPYIHHKTKQEQRIEILFYTQRLLELFALLLLY